jgi:hypothetical protein
MQVRMRDDDVVSMEPATLVGYTHSPIGGPRETIGFR